MRLLLLILLPAALMGQDTIIQTRAFPPRYTINGQSCGTEAVRLHLEQTDLARACTFYKGMKIGHVAATLAAGGACCVIGGAMFGNRSGAQVWNIGAFCAFGGAAGLWLKSIGIKHRAIYPPNTSN